MNIETELDEAVNLLRAVLSADAYKWSIVNDTVNGMDAPSLDVAEEAITDVLESVRAFLARSERAS